MIPTRHLRPKSLIPGAALLAILAVGISGCGSDSDDLRLGNLSCPAVTVAPFTGDQVKWDGNGRDLTNLVSRTHLADATGTCSRSPGDPAVTTSLTVKLDLLRGPAATSRTIDATYFVAVIRRGQVIDREYYPLSGTFESNSSSLHLEGKPVVSKLPLSDLYKGSDYAIETGLQLSPAELADNQSAQRR